MARGTVVIDVDRCKGCELCTTVCAQKLLQMSAERFNARGYRPVQLVDPNGKCTGCALCAAICPDVVLTIYKFEPQRAQVID
jgi:2-oxoglutarate ferredoxin oxidoreductase subunit delta